MSEKEKNYRLGIYEKAIPSNSSFYEKLIAAKSAEFDFMELSIDGSDEKIERINHIDNLAKEIDESKKEVGIGIGSVSVSALRRFALGSMDKEKREYGLKIAFGAIDLAEKIGARLVQIAGLDVCYESSNDNTKLLFEENLKKVAEEGSKRGVLIGLEPMEAEYADTVFKTLNCIKKINSPYLGIYPDSNGLYNASVKYKTKVTDDLISGKGYILAVHCQESDLGDIIEYGKGNINFQEFINTSWNLGVRRFTAEYVCKNELNWQKTLKNTGDYLRGIINVI